MIFSTKNHLLPKSQDLGEEHLMCSKLKATFEFGKEKVKEFKKYVFSLWQEGIEL